MGSEEVDLVRLERLAKEMGPREKGEMSWLSKGRTCAGRAVCVSRSVMSDSLQHYCLRQAPLSMEFFRQEYWSGLPPLKR